MRLHDTGTPNGYTDLHPFLRGPFSWDTVQTRTDTPQTAKINEEMARTISLGIASTATAE